ncbi:hypothetical protein Y032_0001g297 [Ancylostoma ceylanicum]|uniref:Uncharacterized protein n=1 Tax=Ancylostoma ceylanicum TaxID=53326 RepID=A0A016W2W6_9BILA|nr:hypothetical protein Y032_0001g297 [Ancylostoma ceylanicum]
MRYRIYSTPTVTLQKWSYACSPQTESCSSAHFIGDERHAELDFVFNVGVPLPRLIASSPTMGSSRKRRIVADFQNNAIIIAPKGVKRDATCVDPE